MTVVQAHLHPQAVVAPPHPLAPHPLAHLARGVPAQTEVGDPPVANSQTATLRHLRPLRLPMRRTVRRERKDRRRERALWGKCPIRQQLPRRAVLWLAGRETPRWHREVPKGTGWLKIMMMIMKMNRMWEAMVAQLLLRNIQPS